MFEAVREVEIAVRDASKLTSELGTKLMSQAFNAGGPLADATLPKAEQGALASLFVGAIGYYKNPQSHRNVGITDARDAAERIILASHLLRIVDSLAGSPAI